MKKLVNLDEKTILNFIYSSDDLSRKFADYIAECEMDWMSDKLSAFSRTSADWEVGIYNRNYLRVKNSFDFLQSVQKSISWYGCTDKLQKLVNQCEKLYYGNSNLFDFHIEKLCEMYYLSEIKEPINYIEKLLYLIHQQEDNIDLYDYIESFADNRLSDIYVTHDNKMKKVCTIK